METHPIIVFSTKYQLNLLAAVFVVTIVGGFVWWKNYSPNTTPAPVTSEAVYSLTPHWLHQSKPFSLQLRNNSSAIWHATLQQQVDSWNLARAASVVAIPGADDSCIFTKGVITLCSVSYPNNATLAITQTVYNEQTLHFESSLIALNDALLTRGNYANSPAWRNSVLCRNLGLALGAQLRFDEAAEVTSCMNATVQDTSNERNEGPDQIDINSLVKLYSHDDAAEFVPNKYEFPNASDFANPTQWGQRTGTYSSGKIETYELYIGEGFKMVTVVEKI